MKNNLSLLIGATLLATIAGSIAQTAVTDPVGYITMNVSAPTGGSAGISYIGATLVNKVEAKAAAVAGSAGLTINLPASVVTAGQFNKNSVNQPLFYVEIGSGTNEGVWTDIDSNSATSLTVTDPIGAMVATGDVVTIRKHHTFASLFGSTVADLKVTPGVDLNSADEIQLFDPVTQTPTSYFFNTDDLAAAGIAWVNGRTGANANDEVIAPGVGITVVRRNGSGSGIIQVGHVKTGKTVLPVESNINIISIPRATGVSLSQSGLQASGLQGGLDLNSADNIVDLVSNTPTSYFFSTDDLDPGWKPSDATLREGSAIKLLRRGAPFNWTIPAVVIQ